MKNGAPADARYQRLLRVRVHVHVHAMPPGYRLIENAAATILNFYFINNYLALTVF